MARKHNPSFADAWPWQNPWPLLLAGLTATFIAFCLPQRDDTGITVVRVALLLAGLVAAGGAVWLRLHFAGSEADERGRSAGLVALAALVPLLAYGAVPKEWDSIRLLLGILTAVTLSGAALVLLPAAARRAVASVLLLLHFGGIFCAVSSAPPPLAEAPWVTQTLWSRFYRYYLQFMYLNNAYHFYSPDPGPPTLLWFHLDYADGSERWVRLPERAQFATRQQYQRRLALAESVNVTLPPMNPLYTDLACYMRRVAGGDLNQLNVPVRDVVFVPLLDIDPHVQWRPPLPYPRLLMSMYARHVAATYPSEKDPSAEVTGVKAYRVVRFMLTPDQLAKEHSPADLTLLWPFYQGEFDKEGELKDPTDPFLYWVVPIRWCPESRLPPNFPKDDDTIVFGERDDPTLGKLLLIDFTKIHVHRKTTRPSPR